ncbi:MAG: hypothetical protein GKR90_18975 [Pseudomonadales bacterium]|nr:hypothetical protein [Pseudomonadales bacterium]
MAAKIPLHVHSEAHSAQSNATHALRRAPLDEHLEDDACKAAIGAFHRFLRQHQQRREFIRTRLPGSHRIVLDALPYLIHTNSPGLHGWVKDAPSGVQAYTPSQSEKRALLKLAPAHRFQAHSKQQAIESVHIMGSAGSVAQTQSSDLDVWVCLPETLHIAIAPKLTALEAWAATMDLELQIFAVDPRKFQTSTEPAYSSLILDEFYRSSCHLAGRYPLWWLVAPNVPTKGYSASLDKLVSHGLVKQDVFHDFGPVLSHSPQALLPAIEREFAKRLVTPHKTVLKLALLESYAAGAKSLSTTFKEQVIGSSARAVVEQADVAIVDAYLLLADHLDKHYARDHERRDFLRRAWLTKTTRGNSRLAINTDLRVFAQRWNYNEAEIERLRWPETWNLTEFRVESDSFRRVYEHLSLFIFTLLEQHPQDLDLASAGKVLLNETQQMTQMDAHWHPLPPEKHFGTAAISKDAKGWALSDRNHQIVRCDDRLDIIVWMHNRGLTPQVLDPEQRRSSWVRDIWTILGTSNGACLVLNAERTTTDTDQQLITDHDDPLNYGADQTCLVQSVHRLAKNDLGQITCVSLNLVDALTTAINDNLKIFSMGNLRAATINQRIQALVEIISDHLSTNGTACVTTIAGELCAWHPTQDGIKGQRYQTLHSCISDMPCVDGPMWINEQPERWPAIDHILSGPTLWLKSQISGIEITYRDHNTKYQVTAPSRPMYNFSRSMALFLMLLARRNVPTPNLTIAPDEEMLAVGADRNGLGHRLIFEQVGSFWRVHIGPESWPEEVISRSLIRRVRDRILALREGANSYPIYLTDVILSGADFHSHLMAKLRLEKALSHFS